MKTEKKNLGRHPLLEIFNKLYDQQFPKTRSCFDLEKTEEEIRGIENNTGLIISILFRCGIILAIFQIVNFYASFQNKGWGNSQAFVVTTYMIFTLLIFLFAFTMIRNQNNVQQVSRLEASQTRNNFEYFKTTRRLFLEIFDRLRQDVLISIDTPEKLKELIENETQSLAYLIKAVQSSKQDYRTIMTLDFMADEKAKLKKLVELIAHLGLMKTNNVSVVSDKENYDLIKMRADWIYAHIFEDKI